MFKTIVTINRFSSLDFLKFLMAIVVVAIHTHPFEKILVGKFLDYYESLVIVAVPFFFICSGFFLQLKLNYCKEPEKIVFFRNYIYNLIKVYILWTIIYLPLTIYGAYSSGMGLKIGFFSFLRGVFLRGENYYSWPLWYLLSMVLSMILLLFFYKRRLSYIIVFGISIVFYFISICFSPSYIDSLGFNTSFVNIVKNSVGSGRLFSGFVFVFLGTCVASRKLNKNVFTLLILFLVSCYLVDLRVPFLSEFSLITLVYAFFKLAIAFPLITKRELAYGMRKSSTVFFFLHMYVVFIARELLVIKDNLIVFVMTVFICLFSSFYVVKYSERYKLIRWLF